MELDYFANLQGQHDALCGDFGPHRYHLQSRVGASKSTLAGTASQILCLYLLIRFPIMTFTANVLVSSSQIKWLLDYSVRMVMFAIAISTHILTKLSLPERTDPKYCFCVARPVCVCVCVCLFVCSFVCGEFNQVWWFRRFVRCCSWRGPCKMQASFAKSFCLNLSLQTSEACSLHSQHFGSADQVA